MGMSYASPLGISRGVSQDYSSKYIDTGTEQIVERLKIVHECYEEHAKDWAFFLSAYEGGRSFANGRNIFKHTRETQPDYEDRVLRAHNLNFCEPLVDFFTNFIFSESIDRNGGANADFYNTFVKNVNLKGDSVDNFMRGVSDDSQIFGMVYTQVDAPLIDQEYSKLDEQVNKIQPYWVSIKPDEIRDWIVDELGTYLYMKRCQLQRVMASDGSIRRIEKYTEYYPTKVVVTSVDVTDSDKISIYEGPTEVVNKLGEIPIVVTRYKKNHEYPEMGLSFLRDFAGNNREILNLTSLIDEFLYRQCFNILAMEQDSSIPTSDQTTGAIGTSNLLTFPTGAKEPKYISPPVEPSRALQDERDRIKNSMFSRAAQDALNELFNGEKSSGFSQAQSFSKTVPFISSRADGLEHTENALMRLTMKLVGKEWDGKIKYKDRYELTNLTDAMSQFQILVRDLQLGSEAFVKAELKRLAHEYDGKLSPETIAQIEKQIDDLNFKEWQDTQKMAMLGDKPSMGANQAPDKPTTTAEASKESKTNSSPNTGATKK